MFKRDWEKAEACHELPPGTIEKMVHCVYPHKKLKEKVIISGGCANLNIKICFEEESCPFILRIYVRDPEAAYREQKLGVLLNSAVSVPLTYHLQNYDKYQFAITEFIAGITLRDLLLSDVHYDLDAIMYEVGAVLAKIASHSFAKAGFFDKQLVINEAFSENYYQDWIMSSLKHSNVLNCLGSENISKINFYFQQYAHLLPDEQEACLVHGDFDPANILVKQVQGVWKIVGILDWEFSFAGSVLTDVANMLRYAHHMPPEFEGSFLQGLKENGINLPSSWRITTYLLNIGALLDCLIRADLVRTPNKCADCFELITFYLTQLDHVHKINQTDIVIINNAVHRPTGNWTHQVHQLLCYIKKKGFSGAPKPLGFDEYGREILEFLGGTTSDYPWTLNAGSMQALVAAAKLLRAYHDVSKDFLKYYPSLYSNWMLPSRHPQEVVCHGDFAPYNIVFKDEKAVGVIDFDAAHPGPRVWDIAYALYRFAPFMNLPKENHCENLKEQILRAKEFCNAYGLDKISRKGMTELMIERLQALINFMFQSAAERNQKYILTMEAGDHLKYLTDMAYIQQHKLEIEAGLY
jgi:aminoglycoside phosphotransferase (APT) family kinase protein